MPRETSAGAVIFRRSDAGPRYLLLHQSLSHWDFAKGHIEKGENERDTVRREVAEETGITDITFVEGFRETIRYFFKWNGKGVFKTVVYYLLRTETEAVKLSDEHIGHEWLSFDDALKRLKFKNSKQVLEKVNRMILSQQP